MLKFESPPSYIHTYTLVRDAVEIRLLAIFNNFMIISSLEPKRKLQLHEKGKSNRRRVTLSVKDLLITRFFSIQ